jgi:signal transduction histidine kinase
MLRPERRFSLRLVAAFSIVALAFIASALYANWQSLEVEVDAYDITANALPSIDHLTRVIDVLHDLEGLSDDYADMTPAQRETQRPLIRERWKDLDVALSTYLSLPMFPGERDLYTDLPAALRGLDTALDRLFLDAQSGQIPFDAEREVRACVDAAADVVRRMLSFNLQQAHERSTRIGVTRHRVTAVAMVMNGITLLFTLGVAIWILRIFAGYAALQNAHAELSERRAAELEVFGRRVAHDLLSPLSSLTFCLSAFKGAAESDPRLARALSRARQCVARAQGLVDAVFDFARSGGAPQPDAVADVAEVVEHVVDEAQSLQPEERPEVQVDPVPEACLVRCSAGVLGSILANLVRNAVKFMRDSAVRRITIRVAATDAMVRIDVADTGPGVPPGLEEAIFQPYVRGDGVTQAGLGLGLATVRRFCEAHGGSVTVHSVPGRGAVFTVLLPRAQARGVVPAAPPSGGALRSLAG